MQVFLSILWVLMHTYHRTMDNGKIENKKHSPIDDKYDGMQRNYAAGIRVRSLNMHIFILLYTLYQCKKFVKLVYKMST